MGPTMIPFMKIRKGGSRCDQAHLTDVLSDPVSVASRETGLAE